MNYPGFPELFLGTHDIKGHLSGFRKSAHVPDFKSCGSNAY